MVDILMEILIGLAVLLCTLWGVYCGTLLTINRHNKPYIEKWKKWVEAHPFKFKWI